ncbi:MAG: methyltransferase domain-containing protein [Luteibaculaceae bacterium]
MKKKIDSIVDNLLNIKFLYKITKYLNRIKIEHENKKIVNLISPNLTILSGPFKGLQYPTNKAEGSAFMPKILGSYEDELHETIYRISKKDYKTIIDIGCAEGYYAVGMAKLNSNAKVYAFDINENARKLCSLFAEKNNLKHSIEIRTFCTAQTLKEFNYNNPTLIIADCEGYETELFTQDNAQALKNSDILIEIHKNLGADTQKFIHLFKETHRSTIIKSRLKHMASYPELDKLPLSLKNDLNLVERTEQMDWLLLESN